MTTESQRIAGLFAEIRKVYLSFGSLLETAEGRMKEADWLPVSRMGKKYCLSDHGGRIDRPHKWLPLGFSRIYCCPRLPRILACFSIRIELPTDLQESGGIALLTAGAFRFSTDEGWGVRFLPAKSNLSLWHLLRTDRQDDGRFYQHAHPFSWGTGSRPKSWNEETKLIDAATTMARPLEDLKDSNDLESLLIAPLIGAVESIQK